MKRIISVLLCIITAFSFLCIGASAASSNYTAVWSLKASVLDAASNQANDKTNYIGAKNKTVYDSLNAPTVSVYPGQVVWITVHLKTGSSYYVGDMQCPIFYTANIFKSTDQSANCFVWNTAEEYIATAKYNGTPYSKIVESRKSALYPPNWTAKQKSDHQMYTFTAFSDLAKTTTTYANMNADLVTVPIYVKSDAKIGSTGTVFLTNEAQATPAKKSNYFMLSSYKNGDLFDTNTLYSDNFIFDTSLAKINFVVSDKNAKGVEISQKSLEMNYKDTAALTAKVTGSSSAKAVWSTSDSSVASVDENGNITAAGKGTAVITATYGKYSESCTVTVKYSFIQWIIVIVLFGWIWY